MYNWIHITDIQHCFVTISDGTRKETDRDNKNKDKNNREDSSSSDEKVTGRNIFESNNLNSKDEDKVDINSSIDFINDVTSPENIIENTPILIDDDETGTDEGHPIFVYPEATGTILQPEAPSSNANITDEICPPHYSGLVPDHTNCATYYKCNNGFIVSGVGKCAYVECPYPMLYSITKGACIMYTEVQCGDRYEPKAPCKYNMIINSLCNWSIIRINMNNSYEFEINFVKKLTLPIQFFR